MDDNTSINKHSKNSTFFKPYGLQKMVPICSLMASSNSLSTLKFAWFSYTSLSSLTNCQFHNKLAINLKTKEPHATSKGLSQTLTGCCSISDGKDESDAMGGQEEGYPAGAPSQNTQPSPRALGVGDSKEIAKVLIPHDTSSGWQQKWYHQCWEGGRLHQAHHRSEGPHRVLEGWAEEAPEVPARDEVMPRVGRRVTQLGYHILSPFVNFFSV